MLCHRSSGATVFLLCSLAAATAAFAPGHPQARVVPSTRPRSRSGLFSSVSATHNTPIADGLTKTVTRPGSGRAIEFGDFATVKYSCRTTGAKQPFAQSTSQKVIVGDGIMIRGWDAALVTMSVGEKATVTVTDAEKFGYGAGGIPPFVPPGSDLLMDIEVLGVEDGMAMSADLTTGTVSTSEPLKPRTPESIAAAYETRQQEAALLGPGPEGIGWAIDKLKTSYFFGFFEGETGERPPWYLQPSITFPIAFAIVGAAFFVQFAVGGISERGAQSTDELDEVIMTSAAIGQSMTLAMASIKSSL